ncbi:HEAT repeat domain-containing protein [Candidatus Poribacteria bacterium]|nr:HEAT repeat domain-containing protein [Candidatus Poribacteria bacterium]
MKKLLTICLVLIWVVSFGCEQKKIIPEISPGRDKLLGAGLAIEAVEHLKLAEIEEENKDEARSLLLIAYSHALSTNLTWLKSNNLETEYRSERARRLAELNTSEIREIFQILNERHRVQKDARQILIDKGIPVILSILESFNKNRYPKADDDFIIILTQIGTKGLDQLFTAVGSLDTPVPVKIKLIRIIGNIGDTSAQEKLESLKNTVSDAGVKMEINVALYQLGNKAYQKDIEVGLSDNNVMVRRTAARAAEMLNQPSQSKVADALKDPDDIVRRNAAKALQKHVYAEAVDILFEMLTNNSSSSTKQVASNTLNQYAENGIADGLATRLIVLLTKTEIAYHEDRLLIVQLLSKPVLIKQIQAADPYDNLEPKLFEYYNTKETNKMVKDELNMLLLELEELEKQESGE